VNPKKGRSGLDCKTAATAMPSLIKASNKEDARACFVVGGFLKRLKKDKRMEILNIILVS
jgi:hypothetical protein